MSEKRKQTDYLQKATMYDLLAQLYKYTNPHLHIHFYLKHYKYMNKAMNLMRSPAQAEKGEAQIRILHTSPDSPNIDVYINGNSVVKDLAFKQVSQILHLKAGKYHIDIYPAGNMVDSVLNKKITIEEGKSYTLTTIDSVNKMRLLVFLNQPEVPENEAKVRFIQLSPDTAALDIAVKDRDVIFPKVSYKQATEYLGLTPMTVDLEVRTAGTKDILLPLPKATFRPNESYTLILLGLSKNTPELQYIYIKD
ncbi:DUF4397 domain-containing protein [Neobacillus cucumis]|uniref:DUF4397 domain-containing protein n=1 Tax=Neobacillus cucumis TaxID=1740721 RepID=A0A2N5HD98_9BACI|nr:DUF4397 domain-containing protein [Neobacillus cucumis]PLS03509.1 hypothetical protein CVD27_14065 [Neobacillus cucumis]